MAIHTTKLYGRSKAKTLTAVQLALLVVWGWSVGTGHASTGRKKRLFHAVMFPHSLTGIHFTLQICCHCLNISKFLWQCNAMFSCRQLSINFEVSFAYCSLSTDLLNLTFMLMPSRCCSSDYLLASLHFTVLLFFSEKERQCYQFICIISCAVIGLQCRNARLRLIKICPLIYCFTCCLWIKQTMFLAGTSCWPCIP